MVNARGTWIGAAVGARGTRVGAVVGARGTCVGAGAQVNALRVGHEVHTALGVYVIYGGP